MLGCWGLKRSACNVRIRLWPRLPHGCHCLLSIMPMGCRGGGGYDVASCCGMQMLMENPKPCGTGLHSNNTNSKKLFSDTV